MDNRASERLEIVVDIYESVDAVTGHDRSSTPETEDSDGERKPQTQHAAVHPRVGPASAARCFRLTSVLLLMLCLILLTVITVTVTTLSLKYNSLMTEHGQLKMSYNVLTEGSNQTENRLKTVIKQMEQELKDKDELQTSEEQIRRAGWICFNSSMYYISTEKKNWDESRTYCREKGADLVIINSKEEQEFLTWFRRNQLVWIGLSDTEKEGEWKWVDGSGLTNEFWRRSEPNGETKENCTVTGEKWADYSCIRQFHCICEKKLFM